MLTTDILLTIATIAGGSMIGSKLNGLFGGGGTKTAAESPEAKKATLDALAPAAQIELLKEALSDPAVCDALAKHMASAK